mmetsp:Transcript_24914/g.46504  ORF Transcript_24914/g.46504 Transcript_24914/m.46504 type:complete len:390 (+) Transcript_24914:76-1245(+)
MPPTAAAVANNNAAMNARRNHNNHNNTANGPTAIAFANPSSSQQTQPWFLGAPISKLLCMVWALGSLWIIRSGGSGHSSRSSPLGDDGNNYTAGLGLGAVRLLIWHSISSSFFRSTSEVLVGLAFLAHYLRRLERELSSRRLIVWLFTVEAFYTLTQLVTLATLDYEMVASYVWETPAKGPYLIVGGVLYWYWIYVPRLHPRFLSIPMLGMSFSEKTFGFLLATYVLSMQGKASLLVGVVGMVASALFFFLLLLPSSSSTSSNNNRSPLFTMDVPNVIANMFPWDSIGNMLLLDGSPKVYAPLLLMNTGVGNGGTGGGPFFHQQRHGHGVRPRRPVQPQPPAAAAAPPPPSPEAVAQLTAMGFDEQRVKEALQATGNNVERAADRLLTG